MMEYAPEPVLPDESHADMFMPVKGASPVAFRIVQVYDSEIFNTDLVMKLLKSLLDPRFRPQLISRRKRMACVQTDTDSINFFKPVHNSPDMLEAATHAVLLTGRIFKQ